MNGSDFIYGLLAAVAFTANAWGVRGDRWFWITIATIIGVRMLEAVLVRLLPSPEAVAKSIAEREERRAKERAERRDPTSRSYTQPPENRLT
jgi:hypothetical protein